MKRVLLVSALLLVFVSPAWADLLTGAKAYRSGDFATALTEFRRLADDGEPLAQFALGQLYAEGAGVPQDFDEAIKWYERAAKSGLAQAQYTLGVAHYTGIGAARNYLQAALWYEKAARQGDARSQNNLGYLYESGKGVRQNHATAVEWYQLAAESGNVNAQVNLGNAYRVGRGVEPDHELAIAWLRKAIDKWDTSDPLKLWIVESPQSIRPYSETAGAGPAIRVAQDEDLLGGLPSTRFADGPDSAPVETAGESNGEITIVAAPEAEPPVYPWGYDEQLVALVTPASETLSSPSKRQYDLVDDQAETVSVSDGFRVQLGAFSNPENADRGWLQLRDAHPDLLGEMEYDVSLHISKVDLGPDKGIVFRVQAGPFVEIITAQTLCSELKSREVSCFLVRP